MDAYTDFAGVYDIFMDNTPYQEWADFLTELIEKYGISKRRQYAEGVERGDGSIQEEILNSEKIWYWIWDVEPAL